MKSIKKIYLLIPTVVVAIAFIDDPMIIDPDNPYDHDTTDNPDYDNMPNTQSLYTPITGMIICTG
jgi:hypothetical protein